MRLSRPLVYVLLVVLALVLIKVFFLKKQSPAGGQGSPSKTQKSAVSVTILKPVVLDNKMFATGSLFSNEEVVLMPEVSGRIDRIYFKEGSRVNKGDLLVKIDDADLQAQLKKLTLQLQLAVESEERQKKLLAVNGISQEAYDIALNQANTIKTDIELNAAQLAKTSIRAPFTGVIGLKNISEGSTITPSVRIATLQQTDPMKIDFSIPEKYAYIVHTGDLINFTVPGNDSIFKGTIYAIEPRIDPVTRTLQLRALCNNRQGRLFPGSFVRIELVMDQIKNALMIPTQALIPELKGQKVFIVKDGKASPVKVQTGIRTDTDIEITDGLAAGDSLIISGIMQVKPGNELNIKMEEQ